MPRGIVIPQPMCWTVVRMTLYGFAPGQIEAMTEVSHRQQQRIMKRWRETDAVITNTDNRQRGKPRHLSATDISVSEPPH